MATRLNKHYYYYYMGYVCGLPDADREWNWQIKSLDSENWVDGRFTCA